MTPKKRINLITHHGQILLYISKNPQVTYRELSRKLDLTERHVARLVRDLTDSGVVSYQRTPQGNIYKIRKTAKIPQEGVQAKRVIDSLGRLVG